MRLVVHDFSGHPGQVQLSRELARRGHDVEHQYCSSYTTGRGATARRHDDPDGFTVSSISLGKEFARYTPAMRIAQELKYAWMALRAVRSARPDVVVFSNVPIAPLFLMTLALRAIGLPYVFWWQDVYSEAMTNVLRSKLGAVGSLIGWALDRVERSLAKGAAAIVPITDAFLEPLNRWGIDACKATVIPNWGAIDEMPSTPRDNDWARNHQLVGANVAMYAGTLGIKHDPSIIAALAEGMANEATFVVVSQGKGREWLEEHAGHVQSMRLLDYQPYEHLPEMLASADVLVVVLEHDASRYSVPSKVLNYLCAGRPVLAILPTENAAAQMLEEARAGIVVRPGDVAGAVAGLSRLMGDSELQQNMGAAARTYAEAAFDIEAVGARFESVVDRAYDSRRRGNGKLSVRSSAILGMVRKRTCIKG